MSKLTADQIVALFVQRQPAGGWLTVKQTAWLFDTVARARANGARPRTATGALTDGRLWSATVAPNGCANLSIGAEGDEARRARFEHEACLTQVNNEASELLLAGKLDEARALLERFAAEQAR